MLVCLCGGPPKKKVGTLWVTGESLRGWVGQPSEPIWFDPKTHQLSLSVRGLKIEGIPQVGSRDTWCVQ